MFKINHEYRFAEESELEESELLTKIINKAPYQEIKAILDKGYDVNTPEKMPKNFPFLMFPLHFAIALSNIDIVKLLLDYGANIKPSKESESYLGGAIYINSCEKLELLLKYGGDPNEQPKSLLKYVGHPNNKPKDRPALAEFAILEKNLEALKLLVKYGATLKDKYLLEATRIDNVEIFEFLLQKGLNPSINMDGDTLPLFFFVAGLLQDLEKTKLLVKYGVNVNTKGYVKTIYQEEMFSEIPVSVLFFIYSQQEGKDQLKLKEIVKFIIESGVDLNDIYFGENLLPVIFCLNLDNWQHEEVLDFEIEKILLKKGVNANIWEGSTAPITIHNLMKDFYKGLKEHMQECKLAKHLVDLDQMEEFMELLEQYGTNFK